MSELRDHPVIPGTAHRPASNMVDISSPLRPQELPFTAEERGTVTILFGGLTWKHERLIEGLLAGAGYPCQRLPETDRARVLRARPVQSGLFYGGQSA